MSGEVNQASNSEDSVDLLSAEQISQDKDCYVAFEIYEDCQHIKSNAILGSLGEFCAAFYHVPVNNDQGCLDKVKCKAAADGESWMIPRSVVALVKYDMYNGSDIIVRYSNHYIYRGTKHAEEFFKDDINQSQNEALSSSISNRNLRKITMYITSQPCHLSAVNTPKKSCCNVLLELLNDPRLKDVEMCIKPTHIYNAGRSDLVENGKKGIRKLMARGIDITGMEKADWKYLLNLVDMTDGKRQGILSGYSNRGRKALDEQVSKFLDEIKLAQSSAALSIQPSDPQGGNASPELDGSTSETKTTNDRRRPTTNGNMNSRETTTAEHGKQKNKNKKDKS